MANWDPPSALPPPPPDTAVREMPRPRWWTRRLTALPVWGWATAADDRSRDRRRRLRPGRGAAVGDCRRAQFELRDRRDDAIDHPTREHTAGNDRRLHRAPGHHRCPDDCPRHDHPRRQRFRRRRSPPRSRHRPPPVLLPRRPVRRHLHLRRHHHLPRRRWRCRRWCRRRAIRTTRVRVYRSPRMSTAPAGAATARPTCQDRCTSSATTSMDSTATTTALGVNSR